MVKKFIQKGGEMKKDTASLARAEDDSEVAEEFILSITPEIASMFRLFELDIRLKKFSVAHAVNTSRHAEKIVYHGKSILAAILLHFQEVDVDDTEIIQAWIIILSWIAEKEAIGNAPDNLEDIMGWIRWTQDNCGLFTGELQVNEGVLCVEEE